MARKGPSGAGIKSRATEKRWAADAKVGAARREWAQRQLDDLKRERGAEQSAAQPLTKSKAKRPKVKLSRKAALAEATARGEVNKVVPKETQKHGDYQYQRFEFIEVTEGGRRVKKERNVVRNLGGTPIERWHQRGHLDERQMAAILFYQQAWRIWIGQPRVVANWSAVVVRDAQGAAEIYAGTRIAAKESLRLLDNEVFFRVEPGYFAVWQNVVIWDEPAGVAGGRAGFLHKQAEGAARAIVSMLASMIADVVIDSSRRDFGDLLLDLDAARRPGRKSA